MSGASQALAKRIRDHAKRSIDHHVEPSRYATVTSIDPLAADTGGMTLDAEDLVLGYSARVMDRDMGIEVGDTLVLHVVDNEFVVVEVLTDRDV